MVPCRPIPAPVPDLAQVTAISAGAGFACALEMGGEVVCWGRNDSQQLGHPTGGMGDTTCSSGDASTPCNVKPTPVHMPNARQVAAGGGFACAVTEVSAQVYCWGGALLGETGNGMTGASLPPAAITPQVPPGYPGQPAMEAVAVTGGNAHACAIDSSQYLWCWGDNMYGGGLGHPTGTNGDENPTGSRAFNPVPQIVAETADGSIEPIEDVLAVATPEAATCILQNIGGNSIYCWGWALDCEDGDPGFAQNSVWEPRVVAAPPSMAPAVFTALSSRATHVCALTDVGTIYCWGTNGSGQLGIGRTGGGVRDGSYDNGCFYTPQLVQGLTGVTISKIVGAVGDFVLAQASDGTLYGWGANGSGQTGHPPHRDASGDEVCDTAACNPTPSKVLGLP